MYEFGIPTHLLPFEQAVNRHSNEPKSPLEIVQAFLGHSAVARGEQTDNPALPVDGALRGDIPLSIAEWSEA